jgi:hypothetical protein
MAFGHRSEGHLHFFLAGIGVKVSAVPKQSEFQAVKNKLM